jgi:tRNA pseudouridine38-40 synthase
MRTIKLTLCYDGSDFCGWQAQQGLASIQGSLMDIASRLTQENVQVHGAGRTDAGVHALGQVAHFSTKSPLGAGDFQRAFNALLPPTIRVLKAEEVEPRFHARFDAIAKTYQYRIHRNRVLSPIERRYVLHDPFPLDVAAMAEAAHLFEGKHDFSSFGASTGSEETDRDRDPCREVFSSQIYGRAGTYLNGRGFLAPSSEAEPVAPGESACSASGADCPSAELLYVVRGKSFLRYMVRKIVGTLLDVGRGKLRPEDIPEIFAARDRSRSGMTVPPQGLYLVSVEYPEPWKP